jgi:hypothetical protein
MINGFEKIVEERIRKAMLNGEFDDLMGAGEPLVLQDDSHISEDLRLAYKILKNAECLPPEIELRKDIERAEDILRAMPDPAEKYQALKKLNFLILKLNAVRRGSVAHEMPQHYTSKVVSRLEVRKNRSSP